MTVSTISHGKARSDSSPSPVRSSLSRLIWIDLEMSGLNPQSDTVLEVAIVITDGQLDVVAESESWAVYQPPTILNGMDSWNTRVHNRSGLVERCQQSDKNIAAVEREALKFLKRYVEKKHSPMCGNSICQDRRFLATHMPTLEGYFHYRNFDVSAFKIATQLFYPSIAERVKNEKPAEHRALDDIYASIKEMLLYKQQILVATTER